MNCGVEPSTSEITLKQREMSMWHSVDLDCYGCLSSSVIRDRYDDCREETVVESTVRYSNGQPPHNEARAARHLHAGVS